MEASLRPLRTSRTAPFVAAMLTLLIFVCDTITPLEIAVGVFYVAVILFAMNFLRPRHVWMAAGGCVALTIVSYALTKAGSHASGLANAAISICAILATAYLARRLVAAEAAAHEARAQLARVARVTTLGELTTSIAHEVNQPLAAVVTSGQACLRWLAAAPPNLDRARQAIDRIVDDANRASDIIAHVRAMARGAQAAPEPRDVGALVLETLALVRDEIERHDITLRTSFPDRSPRALVDAVQIQQVVLNLVMNAIEALTAVEDRPRELSISASADRFKEIRLTVSDNGPGLDPAELERVFEAFYTHKAHGLGVGLSISRTIIEAHGGRIWAVAAAGGGATFQFTLPVQIGRRA